VTTAPLSKKEIERNMRAVAHATAQQELEGLHVSTATVEDMKRAAREEIRSEDVIRNIHARMKHAQVLHIASAAAPIFKRLAAENHTAGLGPADFSDRTAYYLAELNALHPFREGNGRAVTFESCPVPNTLRWRQ
jgi:prophage maintenance system killer protein